jgi:hypothetical protein
VRLTVLSDPNGFKGVRDRDIMMSGTTKKEALELSVGKPEPETVWSDPQGYKVSTLI